MCGCTFAELGGVVTCHVVKLGSSVLAECSQERMLRLGLVIADSIRAGEQIVVVSSGAIALGWRALDERQRPTDVVGKQAAAAIGQRHLMKHWSRAFDACGIEVAQVLLTHEDFESEQRRTNAMNLFEHLLSRSVVAIVNENDSVSTEELTMGDNDMLASKLSVWLKAESLILATCAPGLMDRNNDVFRGAEGRIPEECFEWIFESSGDGSGGMRSKLLACEHALRGGVNASIVDGRSSRDLKMTIKLWRERAHDSKAPIEASFGTHFRRPS